MQFSSIIITGASSGIGYVLAEQLSEYVQDTIFILGRNLNALNTLKQSIEKKGTCTCVPISIDLSKEYSVHQVVQQINSHNLTIDLLINNAASTYIGSFSNQEPHSISHLLGLNIINLTHLTSAFLQQMVKQNKGHILMISSLYGYKFVPNQALYGASKAYLTAFTQALKLELAGSPITVSLAMPGITRTQFRSRHKKESSKNKWLSYSSDFVATNIISGLKKGKTFMLPGLMNKILFVVVKFIPDFLYNDCILFFNRLRHLNIDTK